MVTCGHSRSDKLMPPGRGGGERLGCKLELGKGVLEVSELLPRLHCRHSGTRLNPQVHRLLLVLAFNTFGEYPQCAGIWSQARDTELNSTDPETKTERVKQGGIVREYYTASYHLRQSEPQRQRSAESLCPRCVPTEQ